MAAQSGPSARHETVHVLTIQRRLDGFILRWCPHSPKFSIVGLTKKRHGRRKSMWIHCGSLASMCSSSGTCGTRRHGLVFGLGLDKKAMRIVHSSPPFGLNKCQDICMSYFPEKRTHNCDKKTFRIRQKVQNPFPDFSLQNPRLSSLGECHTCWNL